MEARIISRVSVGAGLTAHTQNGGEWAGISNTQESARNWDIHAGT